MGALLKVEAPNPGPEPKHMDLLRVLCEGLSKVKESQKSEEILR